jgi:hypothetical protein
VATELERRLRRSRARRLPAIRMEHSGYYESFFAADHPALFHIRCQNCRFSSDVPVGIRLLDSPVVVGHLATRGADVADWYLWALPFVVDVARHRPGPRSLDGTRRRPDTDRHRSCALDADASVHAAGSRPDPTGHP